MHVRWSVYLHDTWKEFTIEDFEWDGDGLDVCPTCKHCGGVMAESYGVGA